MLEGLLYRSNRSLLIWLKEDCGCDADGHVCGKREVKVLQAEIEAAL
jgi:hypothetical protein